MSSIRNSCDRKESHQETLDSIPFHAESLFEGEDRLEYHRIREPQSDVPLGGCLEKLPGSWRMIRVIIE